MCVLGCRGKAGRARTHTTRKHTRPGPQTHTTRRPGARHGESPAGQDVSGDGVECPQIGHTGQIPLGAKVEGTGRGLGGFGKRAARARPAAPPLALATPPHPSRSPALGDVQVDVVAQLLLRQGADHKVALKGLASIVFGPVGRSVASVGVGCLCVLLFVLSPGPKEISELQPTTPGLRVTGRGADRPADRVCSPRATRKNTV